MAEFLPNLDDGELWLPSDIFLNIDVAAADHYRRLNPRRFSSLDELSRNFSALALLPPCPSGNTMVPALILPPKYFERFMQPTQYSTAIASPAARPLTAAVTSFGAVQYPEYESDRRSLMPIAVSPKLLYRYDEHHLLQRLQIPQVAENVVAPSPSLLASRGNGIARVLPEMVKNRLTISFPGRGVSPRRECTGTGVFLPRVTDYSAASDVRRKQGTQNGLDIQISQKMNSITRDGAVARQEKECHNQLPPEMILPRDWTY